MHRIKVGSNLYCTGTDNTSINLWLHQDYSNSRFDVVMLETEPGVLFRAEMWVVWNKEDFPAMKKVKKPNKCRKK